MTRLPTFRSILAIVEPDAGVEALRSAANLADRHGARLTVFSTVEASYDQAALARVAGLAPGDVMAHLRDDRRAAITDLVARTLPGREVEIVIATGKTFIEAIRHVLAHDVDLVIKTAEPLIGVQRILFTSTDQHLLRKCPCPVWLQLPGAPAAPHRILAAVDVDEWDAAEPETLHDLNARVLETALRLGGDAAQIYVLHAWDAVGEGMVWAFSGTGEARQAAKGYADEVRSLRQAALQALLTPFQAQSGAGLRPLLVKGPPETVIADQARLLEADLLVLGTVARTGISGVIIGNTAEDILNTTDCAVAAVKPGSFVSPLAG